MRNIVNNINCVKWMYWIYLLIGYMKCGGIDWGWDVSYIRKSL